MHRPTPYSALLALALLSGLTSSLPIFSTKTVRSLIDISPNISPDLDLSSDGSCLGVGISACDPITVSHASTTKKYVNGTQSSQDEEGSSNSSSTDNSSSNSTAPATSTATTAAATTATSGAGALININLNISPEVDLGGDNTCTGVGVSVCDPVTVGDGTSDSDEATDSASDDSSNDISTISDSESGRLINININVSPDIDLGGDDVCIGVGISACNPIKVSD